MIKSSDRKTIPPTNAPKQTTVTKSTFASSRTLPYGRLNITDEQDNYVNRIEELHFRSSAKECKDFNEYGPVVQATIGGKVGEILVIRLQMEAGENFRVDHKRLVITSPTVPIVDIICRQNCLGPAVYKPSSGMTIFLEAVCSKHCGPITEYQWQPNVKTAYRTTGAKKSRIFLSPGSTQSGLETITLNAKGEGEESIASATYEFGLIKQREIECNVSYGEATVSVMELYMRSCTKAQSLATYYTVTQSIWREGAIVEFAILKRLFNEMAVFYSPFNKNLTVKMFTIQQSEMGKSNFTVARKGKTRNYDNMVKLASRIYYNKGTFSQSPKALGRDGRVWEASEIINCLMPELMVNLGNVNRKKAIMDLATAMLRDIITFSTTMALNSLIVTIMALMPRTNEPKILKYAVALSDACKHLAIKRWEYLKTKNPLLYDKEVESEFIVLKTCADHLITPLYHKDEVQKITTPPPMEGHPIPEDYPSYDEMISGSDLDKYLHISLNAIEIMSRAYILKIMTRQYGWFIEKDKYTFVQADKVRLLSRDIELETCKIKLPSDIGFTGPEQVRLLVVGINQSVLFWNKDLDFTTPLINILIIDKDYNEKHTFDNLVDLYWKTDLPDSDEAFNYTSYSLGEKRAKGEDGFDDLVIPNFRLEFQQHSGLIVSLRHLSEPVRIIFVEGQRVILKDFEDSLLVNTTNIDMEIAPLDYDVWLYFGILPVRILEHVNVTHSNDSDIYMLQEGELLSEDAETFALSAISQQCVQWNGNNINRTSCQPGNRGSRVRIHCRCHSTNNVGGSSFIPQLSKRDIVILSIVLEPIPNYIILELTIAIVACYCIACCFQVFRKKDKQHIYYLGDNLYNHNYAYFVIVTTSGKSQAGTTANVVIKLYGDLANSRPHVLNYPDPDQILLQRGRKNYFILTSSKYLGNIEKIDLWIDCLQLRPMWKCDIVKICDLQTKKWFVFEVHVTFSVLGRLKHFISVSGCEITKTHKGKLGWKRLMGMFWRRIGPEHTWNILSTRDDKSLHYLERITALLLNILSTYAITLLLVVNPMFRPSDAIFERWTMDNFEIGKQALIISLITFPIHRIFIWTFRHATRKSQYRYMYQKKLLSESFTYVCWIGLFLLITVCFCYIVAMSTGISELAVYMWLTFTTLSLLISIFLLENLYLSLYLIITANGKPNIIYHYERIIADSQRQKVYLKEVIPGIFSLRPYLTHLYKPMSAQRYQRKKNEIEQRFKIAKTFRDFVAFLFYFMLLYVLVAVNIDPQRVLMNNHMVNMIKGDTNTISSDNVKSTDQLLEYLNKTFVTTLHNFSWYGDYMAYDPGLMVDFQTKFLGVARIRQKMVVPTTCPAPNFTYEAFRITKCVPFYSPSKEETRNFSTADSLWKFNDPVEAGKTRMHGIITSYSGGGYVSHTGRTLENAYNKINEMAREKWFNKYTSAVIIEFWAYNANRNLFTFATVLFEFTPVGYVHKSYSIYTLTLIFTNYDREFLILIIFSLYFMLVFYQLVNIILKMFIQKAGFWKKSSNWLDIFISLGNWAVIVLYTKKQQVVEHILNELTQKKKSEFIQYFQAEHYNELATICIAVLITISIMGTWRFLRFGYIFKTFELSIYTAAAPLFSALLYCTIIYVQYMFITYLLFGSYVETYKSLTRSVTILTLVGLSIFDDYDHDEVNDMLPVCGMIVYTSYRLCLFYALNIYIAIIRLHHDNSKRYVLNQEPERSILSYFIEECKFCFTSFHRKKKYLMGGEDDEFYLPSDEEPKVTKIHADEEECSGLMEIPSNTLELMAIMLFASMHNQTVRNRSVELTSEDYEMIRSIIYYSIHHHEGNLLAFYKMQLSDTQFYCMSRERLNDMAAIATELFKPAVESPKKKVKPTYKDEISLKRLTRIEHVLKHLDDIIHNIRVYVVHHDH